MLCKPRLSSPQYATQLGQHLVRMLAEAWRCASGDHGRAIQHQRRAHGGYRSARHAGGRQVDAHFAGLHLRILENIRDRIDGPGGNADLFQRGGGLGRQRLQRLQPLGTEAAPSTPEELDKITRDAYQRWGQLIKEVGIEKN